MNDYISYQYLFLPCNPLKTKWLHILTPSIYSQNGPSIPKMDHFHAISIPLKRRKNNIFIPANALSPPGKIAIGL